jgi:acetoin utilization deacetylase AcuC-like enzyme
MAPAPVFLHHASSLRHDTGPHPEQPARIVAIERELSARDWLGYTLLESPAVSTAALQEVHPDSYVRLIERAAASGGAQLDPDTVVSGGSFEAALHAAGGAVALVDMLLDGEASAGLSAHRPPGHHALPEHAMGFCLFNNIAVAARHAVGARGLERVMILDWDVHHGNGTNDIFHADRDVLFVSIHEYPLYPGTGRASDAGSGEGEGFTVNLPVPGGSGDAAFVSLVRDVAVPLGVAFQPELILISAGFDAHRDDPLAGCLVTEEGYAAMTGAVVELAGELGVPVGVVLEGGYALAALARSVAAVLGVLAGSRDAPPVLDEVPVSPLAQAARERLAAWWPTLAG